MQQIFLYTMNGLNPHLKVYMKMKSDNNKSIQVFKVCSELFGPKIVKRDKDLNALLHYSINVFQILQIIMIPTGVLIKLCNSYIRNKKIIYY